MAAATARHETRALLRAHLAAASGYRHLTRHCAVCHRLAQYAALPEPPPHERREGREDPEGRAGRESGEPHEGHEPRESAGTAPARARP
ncbi:DUF6274 family protein [Streptomyces rubrolavendulae]|uniref:Uncharacterized protein n=1 Tax=Streptomyces rubrolavendulae TaxID=285473 RepID=A0A1D8G2T1_9ACTN|nr:DUF6274 family protein [Streptomyces rubrolavendulae]AOT59762.1 hypothetical protein A4G23_02614 [Streptomyces rubrolavendulae]